MLNSLTAEQKNSLLNIESMLGLAADLAHAVATIYLPSADKKWLNIYKQEHPRTQHSRLLPNLTGRRVRTVEEPLVWRCFQNSIALKGKREWTLGTFNNFLVHPLRDRLGRTYGVIAFETAALDELVIEQVLIMINNLNRSVAEDPLYTRLKPEDGLMVVDPQKTIIAANNNARHIFSFRDIPELVGQRTNSVAINWPLVGMVMDAGIAETKELIFHSLLLSIRILPVVPVPKGGCALVIIQDITELRKKDQELLIKSVVIKEIHHRVKNNLQTIASLLRLQSRRAQSAEAKAVLTDCIGRVNSIAIVHEYLSQHEDGLINVAQVAKGIYKAIVSSMLHPEFQLKTEFQAQELLLPSEKATSIALILNELLQNSIEHAFEGRREGTLQVFFQGNGGYYELVITDDGVGLPQDFDINKTISLGLKIIKTMSETELKGNFIFENRPEGGTKAMIRFPMEV